MIEEVRKYVNKNHMIQPGDRIVAGISGGADSVCLLLVLLELRETQSFELSVVHVNHGIRKEAYQDAEYVEMLCRERGIPFRLVEKDVEAVAGIYRLSPEEAGRKVRYEAFRQELARFGSKGKIAVAHNKNDLAETVLFNLFRGSSIKGMCGIAPVRDNVIRPLLCMNRVEIEAYLAEKEIHFCIDKTNAEDTYTRNRIRNHILPYAESHINENASAHIAETADSMREAEELLQRLTKEAFSKCVIPMGEAAGGQDCGLCISAVQLAELDRILQKYLVMECFTVLCGARKDISAVHVENACGLLEKQVGKRVDLPYGLFAERGYREIRIGKQRGKPPEQSRKKQPEASVVTLQPGIYVRVEGLGEVKSRLFPKGESEIIPENRYTKWFDYDKIRKSLLLRNRQIGDFFLINQLGGRKTLKDYMIQEKIPQGERAKLFLLADGEHIVWLIGYRISQYYKVNQNTKNILEVSIDIS